MPRESCLFPCGEWREKRKNSVSLFFKGSRTITGHPGSRTLRHNITPIFQLKVPLPITFLMQDIGSGNIDNWAYAGVGNNDLLNFSI